MMKFLEHMSLKPCDFLPSTGVIGGADGPTVIYVSSSVSKLEAVLFGAVIAAVIILAAFAIAWVLGRKDKK